MIKSVPDYHHHPHLSSCGNHWRKSGYGGNDASIPSYNPVSDWKKFSQDGQRTRCRLRSSKEVTETYRRNQCRLALTFLAPLGSLTKNGLFFFASLANFQNSFRLTYVNLIEQFYGIVLLVCFYKFCYYFLDFFFGFVCDYPIPLNLL